MYAKISNNSVIEFPVNPMEQNPTVSFPSDWQGGDINSITYVRVKDVEPPSVPIGFNLIQNNPTANNADWFQSWSLQVSPLDKLKPILSSYVTALRYKSEVSGVSFANNVYSTDRESQTKYIGIAVTLFTANLQTFSINWKIASNQFVVLNSQQMSGVINSVQTHIQSAFNKEAEYLSLINNSTNTSIANTDFTIGWPI